MAKLTTRKACSSKAAARFRGSKSTPFEQTRRATRLQITMAGGMDFLTAMTEFQPVLITDIEDSGVTGTMQITLLACIPQQCLLQQLNNFWFWSFTAVKGNSRHVVWNMYLGVERFCFCESHVHLKPIEGNTQVSMVLAGFLTPAEHHVFDTLTRCGPRQGCPRASLACSQNNKVERSRHQHNSNPPAATAECTRSGFSPLSSREIHITPHWTPFNANTHPRRQYT